MPLSGPSLNLAGKPSRLGGTVAGIVGALVLLVGLAVALMVGALFAWLTSVAVAFAVGGPIAAVALVVGIFLIAGGRRLRRSGVATEQATLDQALLGLAGERELISAPDVASALGLPVPQADALLTALAKREPERIAVEIDDQGVLWYRAMTGLARVGGVEVEPARGASPAGPERRARVGDDVESDADAAELAARGRR
jgi:hypothetical protein